MKYLKVAETSTDVHLLREVPRKWEPFDTELASALLKISTGSLRRELLKTQEILQKKGETLPGRMAMWLLQQRFLLE
jgi:hypothetical protein